MDLGVRVRWGDQERERVEVFGFGSPSRLRRRVFFSLVSLPVAFFSSTPHQCTFFLVLCFLFWFFILLFGHIGNHLHNVGSILFGKLRGYLWYHDIFGNKSVENGEPPSPHSSVIPSATSRVPDQITQVYTVHFRSYLFCR